MVLLAQLDAVLRFEVAARQVVGAAVRHKGEFSLLVERVKGVSQGGVQPPVGGEGQGAGQVGVGFGDGDVRPYLVIKATAHRGEHAGRIHAAAQKHYQKPGCPGGRACSRVQLHSGQAQGSCRTGVQRGVQKVTSLHGAGS